MCRFVAGWFAGILLMLPIGVAVAEDDATAFFGVWETENGRSRVLIHSCEDEMLLCGNIIWTKDGKRIGEEILSGFMFQNDKHLTGGQIHDPRSGKRYRAKLALQGDGELNVKGCWFVFCGGETWTRTSQHYVDVQTFTADEREDG